MRKIISLVLVAMLFVVFSFAMGCKKKEEAPPPPHLRLNKKPLNQLRLRLLLVSKRLPKQPQLRLRLRLPKKNSILSLLVHSSKGTVCRILINCPFSFFLYSELLTKSYLQK